MLWWGLQMEMTILLPSQPTCTRVFHRMTRQHLSHHTVGLTCPERFQVLFTWCEQLFYPSEC